jgi:hypothetical protein
MSFMMFWEVKFKSREDNPDYNYPEVIVHDSNYFETLEECMAFVLSQGHLDICDIEFHQRSLGTWKSEYTLNAPHRVN